MMADRHNRGALRFLALLGILGLLGPLVLLGVLLGRGVGQASPGDTFTVNSTGDGGDSNPGDGVCDDGTGNCTLRAAIEQANADSDKDTIAFDIPGEAPYTIQPSSPLPAISNPVIIDGTTEPDFAGMPVIELDGSMAGALVDGLLITAGNSTVRGLVINRFGTVEGSDGIELQGNGGNVIEGNCIGTDITCEVTDPDPLLKGDEFGNAGDGVFINGVSNNTIGGTTAAARNIISGNGRGSFDNADGVEISGSGATGNKVQGNYIGTDVSGSLDRGNTNNGVFINDAPNNTIGGTTAAARNIISGNNSDGVEISGSGATGNKVQGNYIGTKADGADDRGNSRAGVRISGAANNTIGGTTAGARNVISGNFRGVEITGSGAAGNQVRGNYIGTDVSGTLDVGNSGDGVYIGTSATNNTIGGTTAGTGNLISGNNSDGVEISSTGTTGNKVQGNLIGTDVSGSLGLGNGFLTSGSGVRISNAPGNTIGGTVAAARNVISANTARGVEISGSAEGNLVQGNYIGTDVSGTASLGNAKDGILINGAPNNTIGGTTAGARNIISGNGSAYLSAGVLISGSGATGNVVQGNYIGTDVSGTLDRGNSADGVLIVDAPSNTIGGTTAGARNIISGNDRHGVEIVSSGATGNLVQGNYIGTKVNGSAALGNGGDGVLISNAPGNTIGGTTAGARNIISGNTAMGVEILDSGATGNLVQGNYIGTDVNGSADLGNVSHGVFINGAPDNSIGGTAAGARNLISGNDAGVFISGVNATGNHVEGNYIGTDAAGTGDLGNTYDGVRVSGSASNNTIGGMVSGAGNIIAANGGDGVIVDETGGTGNAIRRNSIFANAGLGIDLFPDGVTANDAGDGDTGANDLQNFPLLTSATSGSTTVQGTLNSTANTTFIIEFFSVAGCDPSGNGEGKNYLSSMTVTTDSSGKASFAKTFAATVPVGHFVTATATDPSSNTSEFSPCQQVVSGPQPSPTPDLTPTATPTPIAGDVDCDGQVTIVDALLIAQMVVGLVDALPCPELADVDGDGDTSIVDALLIAQTVVGLI